MKLKSYLIQSSFVWMEIIFCYWFDVILLKKIFFNGLKCFNIVYFPPQDYPVDRINALVNTHIAFKSPVFFEKLFGDVCNPDAESDVSTRTLFFEPDVDNLCATNSKYFYPRKIKKGNRWFLIINTGETGCISVYVLNYRCNVSYLFNFCLTFYVI